MTLYNKVTKQWLVASYTYYNDNGTKGNSLIITHQSLKQTI